MAVTVTPNLTLVYDANSATGWTAGNTVSGFQRFGSACLGSQASNNVQHQYFTLSATDLSNQRIYSWLRAHIAVATKANGGFRIILGDGTNRRAYYVGGGDDFGFQLGVWSSFMLDTASLPTNFAQLQGSAAPNVAAITEIGVGFSATAKAVGNVDNIFWDVCRYGLGLTITGGTSGDPGKFQEIVNLDESTSNAWGMVRRLQAGVYGLQGNLQFGNAGASSYFHDEAAVVVVEDHVHGAGTPTPFSLLVAEGTSTHFGGGVSVGTGDDQAGRSGVQFRNANTAQSVSFTATAAGIQTVELYACDFLGFNGGVSFSNDATNAPNHRFSGGSFVGCGQVAAGRVPIRNALFVDSASSIAALSWNENINVRRCQFIANPVGIEHPSAAGSPYTYNGMTFSGSVTADVRNSSGSAIEILLVGGSDPTTSTGAAVTFSLSATHSLTGLVSGTLVTYVRTSDGVTVFQQTAGAGGETSFSYTEAMTVDIKVHHRDYVHILFTGVALGEADASIPIFQVPDRVVLPAT